MNTLNVTALRCDLCGFPLMGLRNDTVFTCAPCKRGIAIKKGKKTICPIRFGAPKKEMEGNPFYLPLWEIVGKVSIGPMAGRAEKVAERIKGIEKVYVTGFSNKRAQMYGDLGLLLTESGEIILEEQTEMSKIVVGTTRGPEEAFRYGDLIIKTILDKRVDITGMQIEFEAKEINLWAMPFVEKEDMILDCVGGKTFPKCSVEDWREIRECQGE